MRFLIFYVFIFLNLILYVHLLIVVLKLQMVLSSIDLLLFYFLEMLLLL